MKAERTEMEIKDLDFKELLQKPVEEPFFAHHLEGQLSNQELKSVVGGGIITDVCVPYDLPPYYICWY